MTDTNAIVEIRMASEGDEAELFVSDLFRMYFRWVDAQRLAPELFCLREGDVGGIKAAIFIVKGCYARLQHETGVHCAKRAPFYTAGPVSTSLVNVIVYPEVDDYPIEASDLRVEAYYTGGAGGQSVSPKHTSVRITHMPTGTVVDCQGGRSQMQNRDKAMLILRSYLAYLQHSKPLDRIRTFDFTTGRVTDHRTNKIVGDIGRVMDGDLSKLMGVEATGD
jgi:peptide chain release factor 1